MYLQFAIITNFLLLLFSITKGDICNDIADVIFLLDASDSIIPRDYDAEKRFVKQFVKRLRMHPADGHVVGVLSYSSSLREISLRPFKSQDVLSLAVDFTSQESLGTRTDIALRRTEEMFRFDGREFAKKIGILVTDGRSRYPNATLKEVDLLKRLDCQLVVVGIGCDVDSKELSKIATSAKMMFTISRFENLEGLITKILSATCTDWITSPTTVGVTTTTSMKTSESSSYRSSERSTKPRDRSTKITSTSTPLVSTIRSSLKSTTEIDSTPQHETSRDTSSTYISTSTEKQTTTKTATDSTTAPTFTISSNTTEASTSHDIDTTFVDKSSETSTTTTRSSADFTTSDTKTKYSTDFTTSDTKTTNDIRTTPGVDTSTRHQETTSTTEFGKTTMLSTATEVLTTSETKQTTSNTGVCRGVARMWSAIYTLDPTDCTAYYICAWPPGESLRAIRQTCRFGTFWDNAALTCRPAKRVLCLADPCRNARTTSYPHKSTCRAGWLCRNGRTYSHICCPRGSSFNPSTDVCGSAFWCTDGCPTTMKYDRCTRWSVPNKETAFYEIISGYSIMERQCAPGAAFVQETCECSRYIDERPAPTTPKPECKPSVYLPFDDDFEDKSGNETPIRNSGVSIAPIVASIGEGTAYFDGNSYIAIDKYKNFDFKTSFSIRFRYWELPDIFRAKYLEGLVTNGDCRVPASVGVGFHRNFTTVDGYLDTVYNRQSKLSLKAYGSWKAVDYSYDGTKISLKINGNERIVWASGGVSRSVAPLVVGYGCRPQYAFYYGYIDELYIYECIP